MACDKCKDIPHSFREKPFVPPDGNRNTIAHACGCGTKWWQYNTVHHLWRDVPNATYRALIDTNGNVAVDIGSGAIVGSDGFDFDDWHDDPDWDCDK